MGLKFRRGSTAQQSGSLAFGEPYVNTTLGTLVVGGATGDIVLSAGGTGSTGNFGAISGSGLDITGNANVAGNLTLGGKLTIGDNSSDTVNVIASLSSSLIPATTNAFDLGSENYFWRDLYISTGSIKFVGAAGTIVGTLSNSGNGMALDGGVVANGNSSFGTSSLAITSVTGSLAVNGRIIATSITGAIAATNGIVSGSSQIASDISASLSAAHLNSKVAGVVSGSSQITYASISSIPSDIVSGSSQITLSSTTGFSTYSTSVDSRITTEKGRVDAILSAADADKDTFAEIVTLINSVDLSNDTSFASFYTASVGRLNNLETTSGSVNISVSNLNTYTGSNDTTNGTQNTRLTALEASASTALSTNGTQATSITNLNSATASLMIETANLEAFSSSALTRLSNLEGKDISITLTGDVTGTGTITDLANVSFATTIAANSVALGTDTTGDYVASMTAGTGITVGTATGEGSTPVITNTGVTSNVAGTGISVSGGTGAVTITNSGVTSAVAGTGVSVSGATGAVTFSIGQAVATSSNAQFNSLGIGMAASATAGRIDATNDIVAFSSSDIRFKENITPIENALDKISKISGNTYDWKAENKAEHGYEGNDVGVIAQEIEAVLPQLVQTRENGYKAVKYDKLVALLIEGIKEQQIQIEELKAQIGSK
jgi:hypothetical protein